MLKIFSILAVILFNTCLFAQHKPVSKFNKTGWLMYYGDQIIWFESNIGKKVKNDRFFTDSSRYSNGLIVRYLGKDVYRFRKIIASGYEISICYQDSITKKIDFSLKDSIWLIPVKAIVDENSPKSYESPIMGLTFLQGTNEVKIVYTFEANYHVLKVGLLRKSDRRKFRKMKYS